MKNKSIFARLFAGSALTLLVLSPMVRGQGVAVVTPYVLPSGVDADPAGNLIQGADGNFYGANPSGGTNGSGTIFTITPTGGYTLLYTFSGLSDGSQPSALVQGADGNFYGTTYAGGSENLGTVFRITPAGALTTIHAFVDTTDSCNPGAALAKGADGNFYGTTTGDYTQGEYVGSVFKITPAGVLTPLHNFTADLDGLFPRTPVTEGADGNFYGTASDEAGTANGTIFKVTPSGTFTTLYTFTSGPLESFYPSGLVEGADGNFYGTASYNGANQAGSIFQITPKGVFTTIYNFSYADEYNSGQGTLIKGADSNLYGTTYKGIFQVTPAGAFTLLYTIGGSGIVRGADSNLYGISDVYDDSGYISNYELFKLSLVTPPAFFQGQAVLDGNVYYLQFFGDDPFGYYAFLGSASYIYHYDLGYEYIQDAEDGLNGMYLYDFASGEFWYTSPSFPFPYLYAFGPNSVLYYYPDTSNPGHYTSNPRYFFDFGTGTVITK